MQEESVKGIIDHIIYRNEENGYTVLSLHTDGKKLTLVGFFQVINEGESIEAFGHMTAHASYGDQFKVLRYEMREPEDREAIERCRPYAVDVSSGIETGGFKDETKMQAFVYTVRKAE